MSLRTARLFISGSILVSFLASALASAQEPRIAVIMDDIGNQLDAGLRSVALPGPVAVAILPHTPFARQLAEEGNRRGKEILVHLPMQATDAAVDPGPGALVLDTEDLEVESVLALAVAAVPHATGISNHMGSLLTRDPLAMRRLMSSLARLDGMFFLDSYTTHLSVGLMTARELGIPSLKRDVFLDADPSPAGIEAAWQRLLDHADARGFAVGIAHPHSLTLATLESRINELVDVRLVTLRELLDSDGIQQSYAEMIGYAPIGDFLARQRVH